VLEGIEQQVAEDTRLDSCVSAYNNPWQIRRMSFSLANASLLWLGGHRVQEKFVKQRLYIIIDEQVK